MGKRTLKKLARRLFLLARREAWRGGTVSYNGVLHWPRGLFQPEWESGCTWTLSPEIELGGSKLRVCVSWYGSAYGPPRVRVFVDNELKHPGGFYDTTNPFTDGWARRLARQEREDGGKNGAVDTRDLMLQEARNKLKGVKDVKDVKDVTTPEPVYCCLCKEAIKEVERDFPSAEQAKPLDRHG